MNRITRKRAAALWLALGVLALGQPASATTMLYYGTQKLATDCSFVVLGRVLTVEAGYHDAMFGDGHHEIYTWTTLQVERTWGWSAPAEMITIEEAGGTVGTRTSIVDGLPRYEVGDEVIVFVEQRPDGHYKTFGMFLGAMRVERDADGQAFAVRSMDAAGTRIVDAGHGADLTPPAAEGRFELEAFLTALESCLSGQGRN
jgi:hypothetical protein